MFIAALFTIAKERKQAKCVACVNGVNVADPCIGVFFINKMNEVLRHDTKWINLKCYTK